jgi:hypothetical protein
MPPRSPRGHDWPALAGATQVGQFGHRLARPREQPA